MSTSKERTKFFDFIIPIVPVVDSTNSYDQFVGHFNNAGIFSQFDQEFLRGISLYIDDMRILKNICNEYIVYHNRIQSTELSLDKLLAIIVYKNLFPKDFSDSQLNRGLVYALFAMKDKLIDQDIAKFQDDINKNCSLIADSKNEMLTSIDELNAIFLKTSLLEVNSKNESGYTSHLEFVKALTAKDARILQYNLPGNAHDYNIENDLTKLEENETYMRRKNAIIHKSENEKERIHSNTLDLQSKIIALRESKLQDILSRENIDSYFSGIQLKNDLGDKDNFKSVKGNDYFSILKFLIRSGYIDESYQDYMTYFYENSISKNDKIFLRSVTDKKTKDYSYELKNPKLIVKYLKLIDFDQAETLNFDLFSYLLKMKDRSKLQEYLVRLISQIERSQLLDFTSQFFARTCETDLFVEALNHHWPNAWTWICQSEFFTEQERHRFAVESLYHSSDEDIVRMNESDNFANYISHNPCFLRIEKPNIERIVARLKLLNIKFDNINIEGVEPDLFQAVYHADLYSLTRDMIWLLLNKVYKLPKNGEYRQRNYSLIHSKPNEPLFRYVRANIVTYFNSMMEFCCRMITDDPEAALEIINNTDIDELGKIQYIEYLQTKLECIKNVDENKLWPILLKHSAVKYSTENILEYFFNSENEMDETLVTFINKGFEPIQFRFNEIAEKFGEKDANNFNGAVVQCKLLSNQKYEKILQLNFCKT